MCVRGGGVFSLTPLGWPYGEQRVSKPAHGTVSHRCRRAKATQHINKAYVFHMQKYQAIRHTAGGGARSLDSSTLDLTSSSSDMCAALLSFSHLNQALLVQTVHHVSYFVFLFFKRAPKTNPHFIAGKKSHICNIWKWKCIRMGLLLVRTQSFMVFTCARVQTSCCLNRSQRELAGLNPEPEQPIYETDTEWNLSDCIKMLFNHLNVNSQMNIRPHIFRILQTLDGVLITHLKISCENVSELFPFPSSVWNSFHCSRDCLKMTSLFWVSCLKC